MFWTLQNPLSQLACQRASAFIGIHCRCPRRSLSLHHGRIVQGDCRLSSPPRCRRPAEGLRFSLPQDVRQHGACQNSDSFLFHGCTSATVAALPPPSSPPSLSLQCFGRRPVAMKPPQQRPLSAGARRCPRNACLIVARLDGGGGGAQCLVFPLNSSHLTECYEALASQKLVCYVGHTYSYTRVLKTNLYTTQKP